MRITKAFIEKALEANSLVDIIGQYTQLTEKGGRHTGLCPFPDGVDGIYQPAD